MLRVTILAVTVTFLGIVPKASGGVDRTFILVGGQSSGAGTIYFRAGYVGDPPTVGGYYCFMGTLAAGLDGLGVRDAIIPEKGIPLLTGASPCSTGFGESLPPVKRTRVNGIPAADIMVNDPRFNWWVSTDNSTWALLEPTVPVTRHGVTFTALEPELGSIAGNVPAVGGVGLGVLVAVLLGIGALIITRRGRSLAT